MPYVLLIIAIVFEVVGTTLMKLSKGMTEPWYTAGMVVCYLLAFGTLAVVLKDIEVGVAYAVWSAVGTALIAGIGIVAFQESINPMKVISLVLIIAGVVGLNLSGVKH